MSAPQQVAIAVLGVIAYLGLGVAVVIAIALTVRGRNTQVPTDEPPTDDSAGEQPATPLDVRA